MKKFKLHWLGGKTEKIEGKGIADAFRRAGYGLRLLEVLDWWEEVQTHYQTIKLQNRPSRPEWFRDDLWEDPTIVISICDPEWDGAYKRWMDGKTPTDDPRWKSGVFACTALKEGR